MASRNTELPFAGRPPVIHPGSGELSLLQEPPLLSLAHRLFELPGEFLGFKSRRFSPDILRRRQRQTLSNEHHKTEYSYFDQSYPIRVSLTTGSCLVGRLEWSTIPYKC